MWQDGTLSLEEYDRQLEDFVQITQKNGDLWRLETAQQGKTVVKYLVKCAVYPQKIQRTYSETHDIDGSDLTLQHESGQDIETTDECTLESFHSSQYPGYLKYEFHVVYSPSYSVPVLYFTASKPDGHLATLDEIWGNVPEVYQARLKQERWTFLTQQEHPLLGRPFYQLHPCHTQDFMRKALTCCEPQKREHVNYLVTWLSTVGPVVGLDVQGITTQGHDQQHATTTHNQ